MEQARGKASSRRHGIHGALANRQAADSRAADLASTIRQLMAAGVVSQRELAGELNRRGIPTARGGRWHRTTVVRMLTRLGLITLGKGKAADARAEAFGPTIRNLEKAGFVSVQAIARELNKRGIRTPQGGKWHLTAVTRLLQRLERLDRISNSRHRR